MDAITPLSADEIRALLREHDRFVLTTHTNPDGDALGSEYALAHALRGAGKTVSVINCDPVPGNLSFLDADGLFQRYDAAAHDATIAGADMIVVVDLNDASRVRGMEHAVRASAARTVVIDHHLDPQPFADGYLIEQGACATAEILYDLLEAAYPMTLEMATGLYVGIMTDTGSFRFERTTPRVHRIAAVLLEAGVDQTLVYRRIYDEYSAGRILLLGRVLAGLELVCGGNATLLRIRESDFAETGTTPEDSDNIVNYGLGVRGVEATVLLTERSDGVKLNFRSRGTTSVHELARSFGGGGHRFAAGATVHGAAFEDVRARLLDALAPLFAS
ncbi:MAG: bifunctional oligoribonuclease/PAP phosphatase NrnA [Ignavibacteria bacterium]|nr:bifunctional oligoribonuclease/PAP phosphatase NrnA [Ignavibacteria bacterium]